MTALTSSGPQKSDFWTSEIRLLDLKRSLLDLRLIFWTSESSSEPQESTSGPQESTSGPQESTSGPQESTSGPQCLEVQIASQAKALGGQGAGGVENRSNTTAPVTRASILTGC